MNPTTEVEAMVEVRLRYRPVGDVLTVTVRSEGPPGPTFQTELDDGTLMEWMRLPDGTGQLTAMQLIGARSRSTRDGTIPELPAALREPALDLMNPGHRHHDHPSAHRPTTPTATHESTVRTDTVDVKVDQPSR
jgi:hypothetical protein